MFSCGGLEGEMDRTTCSVSLPVYRSKTTVSDYLDIPVNNAVNPTGKSFKMLSLDDRLSANSSDKAVTQCH